MYESIRLKHDLFLDYHRSDITLVYLVNEADLTINNIFTLF
jgi:hypothetical protein